LACALIAPARADEPFELRYDLHADLPTIAFALVGSGLWAGSASSLTPHCRWCDRSSDGADTLNPVDAAVRGALRAPNVGAASTAGDVLGYAGAPLLAVGLDALAAWRAGRPRVWFVDLLVITEAASVAELFNEITKNAAARERPYQHFAAPGARSDDPDANKSFYSGHTNFAFALAVSAGTICTLRHYRLAPLVWAVGLAVGVTVGYLRIAADKHYFTDVLTGAALGSATGFVVAWLHRPRREPARPQATAWQIPGGALVGVRGAW
jgi:membrane-associated phospholipid phosphatase